MKIINYIKEEFGVVLMGVFISMMIFYGYCDGELPQSLSAFCLSGWVTTILHSIKGAR